MKLSLPYRSYESGSNVPEKVFNARIEKEVGENVLLDKLTKTKLYSIFNEYTNKETKYYTSSKNVLNWMVENLDKVKLMNSFDNLEIGIQLNEEYGTVQIIAPWPANVNIKVSATAEILDELFRNSEFIPFRVKYANVDNLESTHSNSDKSFRFSVINRNYKFRRDLDKCLASIKFKPTDDTYYFLYRNAGEVYLKRDKIKSPVKESETQKEEDKVEE